jgi:hypothetical protein
LYGQTAIAYAGRAGGVKARGALLKRSEFARVAASNLRMRQTMADDVKTYSGEIARNDVMAIGGEATRFVLKQDKSQIEITGDNGLFQKYLNMQVTVTGKWQWVGVENRRQVFNVETLKP